MKTYLPVIIICIVIILALSLGYWLWSKSSPQTSGEAGSQSPSGAITNTTNTNNKEMPKTADIANKRAILDTSMGKIALEFYPEDAPKAVENFLALAKSGYYNGVTFHRVVRDFVIQAGDPTGTGRGGESIFGANFADELNPAAESYKAGYRKGVLAMANKGSNTNGSQFFIMLKDNPLDHLYTIFGRVIEGQDVVDKIGLVPVAEDDKPVTPVVIKTVTVVDKK